MAVDVTDDHKIRQQTIESNNKVLDKNKGISIYELISQPNVRALIVAALCLTINISFIRTIYGVLFTDDDYDNYTKVLNQYLLGGFCMSIVGHFAMSSYFQGKRMFLLFSGLLIILALNIIWVSFTDID